MNLSQFDGRRVTARGMFAKGLLDGRTYTLRASSLFNGEPTYNFHYRGSISGRFLADSVSRWICQVDSGDLNGLKLEQEKEA